MPRPTRLVRAGRVPVSPRKQLRDIKAKHGVETGISTDAGLIRALKKRKAEIEECPQLLIAGSVDPERLLDDLGIGLESTYKTKILADANEQLKDMHTFPPSARRQIYERALQQRSLPKGVVTLSLDFDTRARTSISTPEWPEGVPRTDAERARVVQPANGRLFAISDRLMTNGLREEYSLVAFLWSVFGVLGAASGSGSPEMPTGLQWTATSGDTTVKLEVDAERLDEIRVDTTHPDSAAASVSLPVKYSIVGKGREDVPRAGWRVRGDPAASSTVSRFTLDVANSLVKERVESLSAGVSRRVLKARQKAALECREVIVGAPATIVVFGELKSQGNAVVLSFANAAANVIAMDTGHTSYHHQLKTAGDAWFRAIGQFDLVKFENGAAQDLSKAVLSKTAPPPGQSGNAGLMLAFGLPGSLAHSTHPLGLPYILGDFDTVLGTLWDVVKAAIMGAGPYIELTQQFVQSGGELTVADNVALQSIPVPTGVRAESGGIVISFSGSGVYTGFLCFRIGFTFTVDVLLYCDNDTLKEVVTNVWMDLDAEWDVISAVIGVVVGFFTLGIGGAVVGGVLGALAPEIVEDIVDTSVSPDLVGTPLFETAGVGALSIESRELCGALGLAGFILTVAKMFD